MNTRQKVETRQNAIEKEINEPGKAKTVTRDSRVDIEVQKRNILGARDNGKTQEKKKRRRK